LRATGTGGNQTTDYTKLGHIITSSKPSPNHHADIGYVTARVYMAWFGNVVEDLEAFLAGIPARLLQPGSFS
jgi:hypothetical protein